MTHPGGLLSAYDLFTSNFDIFRRVRVSLFQRLLAPPAVPSKHIGMVGFLCPTFLFSVISFHRYTHRGSPIQKSQRVFALWLFLLFFLSSFLS